MALSYPQRVAISISVLSGAAVAAALGTQYLLGMQPCPWCIAQRVVFVLMAALGLLATFNKGVARALNAVLGFLGGCGAGLALWQHFVAAKATSCAMSAADRWLSASGLDRALPFLFEPKASCADAAVSLLGVPYEAWSFALFVILAGWALKALTQRTTAG